MLEYNDKGHGFPILLLHGFCEDKSLWSYCEKELSSRYRIITPDLPGFGESRLEDTELSMEYFAEKIKLLLDDLKIEKCILIGHSLGGYISLAFAEKYEIRLAGYGLFNSTAFADSEERKENRNKTITFIEKYGVPTFAQSFIPPLFSLQNKTTLKTEIEALIKAATNSSEVGVLQTTKAMRDRKERIDVLKKSTVPVLFVIGENDTAVPMEKSLEQCYLPKLHSVHFLANAGHMGMIENKIESVKILFDFIELCH